MFYFIPNYILPIGYTKYYYSKLIFVLFLNILVLSSDFTDTVVDIVAGPEYGHRVCHVDIVVVQFCVIILMCDT